METTTEPLSSEDRRRAESHLDIVKRYFELADAGKPETAELFSEEIQLYFPVFGRRVGKAAFGYFVEGFMTKVAAIAHNIDDFNYIVAGDTVVVEGTTYGTAVDGSKWSGGQTPGGRFCSVFVIEDGLITRMSIYTDPDYTSQAVHGFGWNREPEGGW